MTSFKVWAPFAKRVRLVIGDDEFDLAETDGWWQRDVEEAGPGTDYWYQIGRASCRERV